MNDDSKYIESNLRSALEFIKENWKDDIAVQYTTYVENMIKRLAVCARNREQISSMIDDIYKRCEDIASSEGDPKVRVRRR